MNKYLEQFPVPTALQIQADDLAAWRGILNDEAFIKLQRKCIEQNSKLVTGQHSGYDVFRGDDMLQFVLDLCHQVT